MHRAFHLLSLGAALVALNACSSHSVHTQGALGPYDAQGNYIEAWADDPSKWRYPAGGASSAQIDVPRGDVTPLWGHNEPAVILPSGGSTSKPKAQAARTVTAPPPPSRSTTASRPQATAAKPVTTTRRPATTAAKPKPQPKPAAPKVITIQKGDNLGKLAARHGTTVSELKRANGLKGDLIIAGKTLKIPPKKR